MRSKILLALAGVLCTTALAQAEKTTPQSRTQIDNPYCKVKTYTRPQVRGKVRAKFEKGVGPVIYLDERILVRKELTKFLIAHECCHHTLGHLELINQNRPFTIGAQSQEFAKKIELDADCCAARLLKDQNDRPALENAKQFMMRFGPKPTGFGYPAGIQRSMVIRHCSNNKSNQKATIYMNETKPGQKP